MSGGHLPVVVVGAGIVGLAVARELLVRHDGLEVVVLDKEPEPARHQTGHNSGVVHAGIYYKPGTLKAELCSLGRVLLRDFAIEHAVAYEAIGKLVVAVDELEVERLDALERSATDNGVPGLERIGPAGIAEHEPHAVGLAALWSPETAIIDYGAVCDALVLDITRRGGRVEPSSEVVAVTTRSGCVEVETPHRTIAARSVVLCAGLQADRVGRAAGGSDEPRIVPFRGEYLAVSEEKRDLIRGLIYPVPDPRYPFLGVHYTPRIGGDVEIGPNAVPALAREGYRRRDVSLRDVAELASSPGFARLARRHWRTGLSEMWGSLSVRAYMQRAMCYVPEIGPGDVSRASAGVRAQAVDRDGSLVDDFRIEVDGGIVSVRNAPSPAATSSLAIARHVAERVPLG